MSKARTDIFALNDILFEQLEALTNPDLSGEELKGEIARSKAVASLANNIINVAEVSLSAQRIVCQEGEFAKSTQKLLGEM